MKNFTLLLMSIFLMVQFSFSQDSEIEKYCKKIKVKVDKFNGETEYSTPILKQICFYKIIKNGESIVYMRISTIGSTPSTGEGVTLLLENGVKIEKNIETSVDVNNYAQFEHSAFFILTKDEIELLKKYNITDTRLYIFDMTIRKPFQYRAYLICLDSKG